MKTRAWPVIGDWTGLSASRFAHNWASRSAVWRDACKRGLPRKVLGNAVRCSNRGVEEAAVHASACSPNGTNRLDARSGTAVQIAQQSPWRTSVMPPRFETLLTIVRPIRLWGTGENLVDHEQPPSDLQLLQKRRFIGMERD